jgi:hypothetical protein
VGQVTVLPAIYPSSTGVPPVRPARCRCYYFVTRDPDTGDRLMDDRDLGPTKDKRIENVFQSSRPGDMLELSVGFLDPEGVLSDYHLHDIGRAFQDFVHFSVTQDSGYGVFI